MFVEGESIKMIIVHLYLQLYTQIINVPKFLAFSAIRWAMVSCSMSHSIFSIKSELEYDNGT